MNKSEFLQALQQRINLLEDDEQKDIIDEYSQHIDMKIKNGMTEEEAIEEFGTLDQLVSDILSAYHVKAPITSSHEDLEGDLVDSEGKSFLHKGAQVTAGAAEATKQGFAKLKESTKNFAGKIKRAPKKSQEPNYDEDTEASPTAKRGNRIAGMAHGIANGGKAVGSGAVGLASTAIRWCWNALVFCLCACLLFCGLFCLFAFGFCLVLQIQGYPLLGVCLCALGMLLATMSLTLLSARLIRRKPKDGAPDERVSSENHDVQLASAQPFAPTAPMKPIR